MCDGLVVFNCVLIAVDDLGGFVHVRVAYTYGVHFFAVFDSLLIDVMKWEGCKFAFRAPPLLPNRFYECLMGVQYMSMVWEGKCALSFRISSLLPASQ